MKILVLNCGSSSLKYQLINMENEQVIAKGNYEKIGQDDSFLTHKVNDKKYSIKKIAKDHYVAIQEVINQLLKSDYKVINNLDEIDAIGHRIVHGGEKFKSSALVTEQVIKDIEECAKLAPLHNPAAVIGIRACEEMFPNRKMVVVFDTAFHQTMPKEHYLYPIPYKYYEKYGVRKYGAHGTSHSYVSKRVANLMNKKVEDLKIISCHLGQGASLCAIENGVSVDTSMGLTPLGGIPMCARSGDLDPSVVTFLMEQENLTTKQMNEILNTESGVYGISNISKDFRDIELEKQKGDERASLSLDYYCYIVAQYIARYIVTLKGLDVLIFTAGIGENQKNVRKQICDNLEFMGIEIDENKNNNKGEEIEISKDTSKVKIWIIPTNEELMIAKETLNLI